MSVCEWCERTPCVPTCPYEALREHAKERRETLEWKARAEKAEADLYKLQSLVSGSSALSGTSKCAGCGVLKVLPYRRDDLGGYVCLTCVEKYLDATLEELYDLKVRLAKIDAEQAAMVSKADRCLNCAFGTRPCVLRRMRAEKLKLEARLAEVEGGSVGGA